MHYKNVIISGFTMNTIFQFVGPSKAIWKFQGKTLRFWDFTIWNWDLRNKVWNWDFANQHWPSKFRILWFNPFDIGVLGFSPHQSTLVYWLQYCGCPFSLALYWKGLQFYCKSHLKNIVVALSSISSQVLLQVFVQPQ